MDMCDDSFVPFDNFYVYQFDAFADPLIRDNVFFRGNWWVGVELAHRRQWGIICRWKVIRKFPK